VRATAHGAVQVRERRIVPAAVRTSALDPVPVRVLASGAVEAALVIAVSHRVRVLVRAATRLVAADLAAVLRDQPAVAEVIAWAAVASAVAAAAAVVAGVAAEVGDKELRETMNRISKQIAKLPD
jgi:hypothetical protein